MRSFIQRHAVLIAVFAPLLVGAVLIVGVASVLAYSMDRTRESADVSRYGEFLRSFNAKYTSHLPSAIPRTARDAKLAYKQRSGLGPSSTWLDVSFVLEPAEAKRLVDDARAALAAAELDPQIVRQSERSATVETAVRGGELEIDPESGAVWIRLRAN